MRAFGRDGPVRFTIRGEPASKANSRQIVTIRGRPASIKSAKARAYAMTAVVQIPVRARRMFEGPVRVTIYIWYATQRPDLDASVILDVLQGSVYVNDRQVRELHLYHGIDKANPRAEISVEPIALVVA